MPKKKKVKTLDETLREIEEYNRKHGTSLSYGKYRELERLGKLEEKDEQTV